MLPKFLLAALVGAVSAASTAKVANGKTCDCNPLEKGAFPSQPSAPGPH